MLSELRRRHPEVDFDARAAASENSTAIEGLEVRLATLTTSFLTLHASLLTHCLFQKRNKIWPPVCFERGNRWETTRKPWVDTLVNWGRAVGGTIGVPARRCAFLHCLFDARLYVCNDRDENINPGLAYMVSYAEDICNYKPCQYWSVPKGLNCGGQFFVSLPFLVYLLGGLFSRAFTTSGTGSQGSGY